MPRVWQRVGSGISERWRGLRCVWKESETEKAEERSKSQSQRAPKERRVEVPGGGVVACAAPRSAFGHSTVRLKFEQ